jgi:spermidine/putrescine transport system permease protein
VLMPRRNVVMAWPAFAVLAIFFIIPMSFFLIVSFWSLKAYRLTPGFTLRNYVTAYEQYLYVGGFTFAMALIIATITTVLALAIAFFIRFRAGKLGDLLLFIVLVTMFGGYLVKIYAWKTILGQHGILNELMVRTGLVEAPVQWLLYSPSAVVITLVHFLLPFAILPIYGALRNLADTPIDAARDLGAKPAYIFRNVIVPQCRAGILTAFSLTFLVAAGDYVTARLVGGTDSVMIGVFVESQFVNRFNSPLGSALAFSILAACLLSLAMFARGLRSFLRAR